ncbi:fungal-specific transcription factor domain-containing protein [Apodospora peruviana]|uniref:Fungal-specific transcription factor domain-containing protein n=1 Tax=Apodospora peruviana TaxID=516989 RepID=A0AAE0IBC1_9PEZI|nr:fungal-specific transcription factor domain-containing protein [Apodospora peruviana]
MNFSGSSCWTCRLRRKKCDGYSPVCRVCSALLITCHNSPKKPDWVDGGERQRQMAEQLKQEVRDKAPYRRSLAYAQAMEGPMPGTDTAPLGHSHNLPENGSRPGNPSSVDPPQDEDDAPEIFLDKHLQQPAPPPAWAWAGLDRGLVVCYLDFYFPFLFPFYQPSMLDRGRAWVIDFITDSQAMEQTTLSLSSYFFSLALGMGTTTTKGGSDSAQQQQHETCKQLAWEKLLSQIHGTFGLLREELQWLTATSMSEHHLPRALQIMGCILLLQRFETAVWSFENCEAHLSAAVGLFQQVLEGAGGAEEAADSTVPGSWGSRFSLIMRQLRGHGPSWPRQFMTFQAPSSEQMAFRFFSALLLVDDIVVSTALGEEPRLLQYHDSILGSGQWAPTEKDNRDAHIISLGSIVGCQNWAMVAVAKISALDAWKKRQKLAGDLDMMELVLRATAIKSMLAANLARATVSPPSGASADDTNMAWGDMFTPCNGQPSVLAAQSLLATRIWAHAACLYLSVVVSGWQPFSSEVRHHVGCVLDLLAQRMLSRAVLRTIAWPFCVAGCLAGPAQEPLFRSVVEGLWPPGLFGPVLKALEIMESVWRNKDSVDSTTWDLAACFRGLGHFVLLV